MNEFSNRTIKGYEFRERIGAGGFGAVYRAYQPSVGREVAIKVILPERANNIDFIRRFELEAQIIARLEHPHIVPLYDYWRDPEGAFLVMRWLQESLRGSLRRGPWSPEATARLLEQIGGALMVAHREDVIHRDIKPDNILLDEDENAYLADFGIAKDLSARDGNQTEEGAIVGSPAYITPEQIRGEQVTGRSDIYSLGLVIYEALIADKPYPDATTPYELISKHLNTPLPPLQSRRANLPAALNEVLQTATAKNPAQRYATVGRFATAFRAAIPNMQRAQVQPLAEPLTERELDILKLMLDGLSNKEISTALHLSGSTVRWYVQQIYNKLDVHSRNQAIDRARQLNLLNLRGAVTDSGISSILIGAAGGVNIADAEPDTYLASLSTSRQVNPYKGLRAFQEADTADFFGRATLIEQLLARMVDDKSGHFLAVVGPSGSGKSSVVRAGLIPSLRRGGFPNSSRWLVTEMLPGTHPFEELEAALIRVSNMPIPGLLHELTEDRRGLVRTAKRVLPADQDVELVLLIDQFEELFTLVEDETVRAHFIDALLSAVTDPRSRIRIILTLRADFYDRPLNYPNLGELMRSRSEIVLPLDDAELERAIAGPAERIGMVLENGLSGAILKDVSEQPGALPLLQYALTELFERRKGNMLTVAAYRELGGIAGALARRADELYNEFDDAGKEAARQLFLRLITPGEGTEDTRRRVLRSELDGTLALDEVVNAYTQYRLLTLDRDPLTRGPTIEVAHEALIRTWTRLRDWLADSREALRIQRRLLAAVGEWNTAKQDRSFLASGARLTQFETLTGGDKIALNSEERAYLQASLDERDRVALEEQTRQERELELAKQAAVSAQKAVRSQRAAANRLRYLVGALAIFLVIATMLTGWALNQSQQAQINAQTATVAQGLALNQAATAIFAQATLQRSRDEGQSIILSSGAQDALRNNQPDLALALALQANAITAPPIEARRALADAADSSRIVRRFQEHKAVVLAFALSPNGKMVASASPDNTLLLWEVATGQTLQHFTYYGPAITAIKFSPDGQKLLTGTYDGSLSLWDVKTGSLLNQFTGRAGQVNGIAFSPDGQTVLSGTDENAVILWDVATGTSIRHFQGHSGSVRSVTFSPDGKMALSASADKSIILWDVVTGDLVRRFQGHTGVVNSVAFSPDGQAIISASDDKSVVLWDVASGNMMKRFQGHTNLVLSVVFNSDGTTLLSGGIDGSVILWDIASGTSRYRFVGHTSGVLNVAFSPDGLTAISGSADTSLIVWDTSPEIRPRRFLAHTDQVWSGVFSVNGKTILSAAADQSVVLWDATTATIIRRFDGYTHLYSAVFSPDGQSFLTGGVGGKVLWRDMSTGNVRRTFTYGDDQAVYSVAFAPDGKTILAGTATGLVIQWDIDTGATVSLFNEHQAAVYCVAFSPDGKTIVSASGDNSLILWDVRTAKMLRQFVGHTQEVRSVAFSPDGHTIVSGAADNTVILWDTDTGNILRRLQGHTGPVYSVAFSPNGQTIASGSWDTTVILWDVKSGDSLRRLHGHTDYILSVAFNADGQSVITSSADNSLMLWDAQPYPNGLTDWVKSHRFIPDLTCEQRLTYRLNLQCNAQGLVPTPPVPSTPKFAS